ncbi:hypothetical protein LMG8520_0836 [Lactococcus lactis subsp. lactis]|uniref:Uncharacterized protein n=2 Tax=Lactococcus lactis TaxID=1358 RepID=A0A2A5SHQ9_LACLH|nr:hypothetical protein LMG8520_0836 [Lactococcus lactis subsp. lactis]PCS13019.1 hypothetical protein RU90_GL002434 [Lactococcus lactis subsp. hordniae]
MRPRGALKLGIEKIADKIPVSNFSLFHYFFISLFYFFCH